MIKISNLHAFYGKSHILRGINLTVDKGEIVALLGRNGVGRSTLVKSIMGLVPTTGSILFKDNEIVGNATHDIALKGIGYVPENRDVFSTLTVKENLLLGVKDKNVKAEWTVEEMFSLFPNLKERADVIASAISGGEQQMLTMCRCLMGNPEFMMIDEPTEGLSPQMVETVAELLKKIASKGIAILLVEQKLTIALRLARRVYLMGHGEIVFEGTPKELEKNTSIRKEWLEV
ncbi:MAG: ABC transporter ATP-binding protein [Gammaproteobacteria bacterium]|jgi:branched-chain amino acid transport system ATP-binding protein|nr:ABC transporter ATP-binding protein [Pelagibacterales bacterium]MBT7543698.1 ABC transporter ATP-binding protein [Gammaproteobacteria bacterium]MDG2268600.1 ABC transporter ATP-binding protein [Alphaproteobacteria bacterium]